MKIFVDKNKKHTEKKFSGTVKTLLKELKINSETVIVVRNNELITEDIELVNKDEIKILSVVSGG